MSKATRAVFASYNIHKCVGSDRRFDPERVAAVIGEIGADVIAHPGGGQALRRPRRPPRPRRDRARRRPRAGAGSRTATAATAGTATSSSSARALVRGLRQIRLPGLEPRGAIVVDLDLATGPVRVVAAHLGLLRHVAAPPGRGPARAGRRVDRAAGGADGRPQRVAAAPALGAAAASPRASAPLGLGVPSFPAFFPVLALDRVLTRPHGLIEEIAAHQTALSRLASDHLPVRAVVRLDMRPAGVRPPHRAAPAAIRRPTESTHEPSRRPPRRRPRRRAAAGPRRRRGRDRSLPAGPTPTDDGYVTYEEAVRVFPRLQPVSFHKNDPNGDGRLTKTEYPLLDNWYWVTYMSAELSGPCRPGAKPT